MVRMMTLVCLLASSVLRSVCAFNSSHELLKKNASITRLTRRCLSMSSSPKSIMIFASEVPVIANLNKYRNIEDVFYEVWSRTDHKVVEHLESELSVPTLQEQEKILITESGADELRRQALEQSSTIQSTQELNEVTESLSKGIEQLPNVKEEVKSHLIQTVKSEIQKDYGSRLESKAIEDYEAKEKVKVYDSNLKFHKIPIGKVNDTEVWVGGRIDGKVGERVVEVKNRMKRFMNPLPKYDVAQLQTYSCTYWTVQKGNWSNTCERRRG